MGMCQCVCAECGREYVPRGGGEGASVLARQPLLRPGIRSISKEPTWSRLASQDDSTSKISHLERGVEMTRDKNSGPPPTPPYCIAPGHSSLRNGGEDCIQQHFLQDQGVGVRKMVHNREGCVSPMSWSRGGERRHPVESAHRTPCW